MFSKILHTNTFESILIKKAQGSWIWDVDDKKYLDLESGMWCVNLGHNHPYVIAQMKAQIDQIIHRNKNFLTPITLEAAEIVLNLFPNSLDVVTFLNSGSEAVEFAISFAKKVSKRKDILSLEHSYLGAFGQAKHSSFTSNVKNKYKIPYPICTKEQCSCLKLYQSKVDELFQNPQTIPAAFILEPIMVSGGVYKPCSTFIQYIVKKIQEYNGLVIVDEITTGFGRAGKMFGYELFNIDPDIVIMGKGLGNGYPISAVVTKSSLENKISQSNLYYVQSHQLDPLGAAVIKSVIEVFNEDQIITKSIKSYKEINKFLLELNLPWIQEIRSFGMIFGIVIKRTELQSTNELISLLKNRFLESGILMGFNLSEGMLRFLPPLTITDDEIVFLKETINDIFNF